MNSNIQKIFDYFFDYARDENYYDWDFIEDLQIVIKNCSTEAKLDPTLIANTEIVDSGVNQMGNEIIDPIYEILKKDKRTRIRFLYI